MKNRFGARVGFIGLATCTLVGCDSRAGSDYPGTAVFHLEGRVVLPPDAPSGSLEPVLTCRASEEKTIIMKVEARGSFPSRFSLDLYEPVPTECMDTPADWLELSGGRRFAFLTIAAMAADHPEAVYVTTLDTGYDDKASDPRCAADPACEAVAHWCVTDDDGSERCKDAYFGGCRPEQDDACKPLYTGGDPAVYMNLDDPGVFAGVSKNYVLWAESGLPKSTVLAHVLGLTEDIPPGYSVIALGAERVMDECSGDDGGDCAGASDTGECVGEACAEPFYGEALARYNQRHGTSYATEDDLFSSELSEEELDSAFQELHNAALTLAVEAGVDVSAYVGTRVIRDPMERLDLPLVPADARADLPL
jgi:hypothetical protein